MTSTGSTSSGIKLYVDGVEESYTTTGAFTQSHPTNTSASVNIGGTNGTTGAYAEQIQDVQLYWTKVLSVGEVGSIYTSRGYVTDITHRWNFINPAKTAIINSVGGLHATKGAAGTLGHSSLLITTTSELAGTLPSTISEPTVIKIVNDGIIQHIGT